MGRDAMRELFIEELADIYDAEHQILEALPKMRDEASAEDLKEAFSDHHEQTKGHVGRIEQVFELFDEEPRREPCKGVQGLVEEGEETIDEIDDPDAKDAALIAAAQRVEHYEMAAYGTLRTWAHDLVEGKAVDVLQQTLNEEAETDDLLTKLATDQVNRQAARTG